MSQRENLRLLVTAALFAAAITVMTAYMLHIPIPTGGYIHLGDALIYLAACLLPVPCAAAAAAIGAGLADLLTAPTFFDEIRIPVIKHDFGPGHRRFLWYRFCYCRRSW